LVAAGCEERQRDDPGPRPAAIVRDAAQRTLRAGPANLRVHVSSVTAEYSVVGGVELATDRFLARAYVKRSTITLHGEPIQVLGLGGETYEIGRGAGFDPTNVSGCAYDPHQPIGNLGGAASVQEAVSLVGIAVRLLRDGTRAASVIRDVAGSTTYRAQVDPARASVAPSARGSDEVVVVHPKRLARHLGPMRVKVDPDGLVRRIAFELRNYRPWSPGPGRTRGRRRERVAIALAMGGFGRELEVRQPPCIAME
jgi:hypothetical protein